MSECWNFFYTWQSYFEWNFTKCPLAFKAENSQVSCFLKIFETMSVPSFLGNSNDIPHRMIPSQVTMTNPKLQQKQWLARKVCPWSSRHWVITCLREISLREGNVVERSWQVYTILLVLMIPHGSYSHVRKMSLKIVLDSDDSIHEFSMQCQTCFCCFTVCKCVGCIAEHLLFPLQTRRTFRHAKRRETCRTLMESLHAGWNGASIVLWIAAVTRHLWVM